MVSDHSFTTILTFRIVSLWSKLFEFGLIGNVVMILMLHLVAIGYFSFKLFIFKAAGEEREPTK